MIKAICNESIVIPDEENVPVKYEPGQVFEMDEDIFQALKEAGLKIEKANKTEKKEANLTNEF
jgi:hypothetical protein